MNQISLTQMLESSAKRTETITKLDWRSQIQYLHEIVAEVGDWQASIFKAFGQPRYASDKVKPRTIFDSGYDPRRLRFSGATLTQQQKVSQTKEDSTVQYGSWLHTDENYFLDEMLPTTTSFQVDPIYTLYNLKIVVPRGELVKESLHLLSERMQKKSSWF